MAFASARRDHVRSRTPTLKREIKQPRFIHNGRLYLYEGSIFDKLQDSTLYTGSHKHRFDEEGRGRGLRGRDSQTVSNYVSYYSNEDRRNSGDDSKATKWTGSLRADVHYPTTLKTLTTVGHAPSSGTHHSMGVYDADSQFQRSSNVSPARKYRGDQNPQAVATPTLSPSSSVMDSVPQRHTYNTSGGGGNRDVATTAAGYGEPRMSFSELMALSPPTPVFDRGGDEARHQNSYRTNVQQPHVSPMDLMYSDHHRQDRGEYTNDFSTYADNNYNRNGVGGGLHDDDDEALIAPPRQRGPTRTAVLIRDQSNKQQIGSLFRTMLLDDEFQAVDEHQRKDQRNYAAKKQQREESKQKEELAAQQLRTEGSRREATTTRPPAGQAVAFSPFDVYAEQPSSLQGNRLQQDAYKTDGAMSGGGDDFSLDEMLAMMDTARTKQASSKLL